MLTPVYESPKIVSMPDVLTAVYDYVLAYGLPAMHSDNIYRGWQNRAALPPNTNEYAIISFVSNVRRGTSVETLEIKGVKDAEPETYTVATYYEATVQIDCCSDSDAGRQRATMLSNFARSHIGVAAFKAHGISIIDASAPSDISMVDEAHQFVQRTMLTLRLSYWVTGAVDTAWFNDVNLIGVHDVDAFTKGV